MRNKKNQGFFIPHKTEVFRGKRAVSELVATVLIVLVTIAAVGLIVGAVIPMIKGSIEKAKLCTDAGITLNKDYSFYNATTGELNLVLSRGATEVAISKIQIKLRDGTGASNTTKVSEIPGTNADKIYKIKNADLGVGKPVAVGIASIIAIGQTENICEMIETTL